MRWIYRINNEDSECVYYSSKKKAENACLCWNKEYYADIKDGRTFKEYVNSQEFDVYYVTRELVY